MSRFHQLVIAASLSLITITGCSNNPESTSTQTSPDATPAATAKPASENTATTSGQGIQGLLGVVSKTKAAADKGDFATAKKEFDGFEDIWEKVEDPIRAKFKGNYNAIEKSADDVKDNLDDSKPSKEKVSAALQSLDKNLKALPKS